MDNDFQEACKFCGKNISYSNTTLHTVVCEKRLVINEIPFFFLIKNTNLTFFRLTKCMLPKCQKWLPLEQLLDHGQRAHKITFFNGCVDEISVPLVLNFHKFGNRSLPTPITFLFAPPKDFKGYEERTISAQKILARPLNKMALTLNFRKVIDIRTKQLATALFLTSSLDASVNTNFGVMAKIKTRLGKLVTPLKKLYPHEFGSKTLTSSGAKNAIVVYDSVLTKGNKNILIKKQPLIFFFFQFLRSPIAQDAKLFSDHFICRLQPFLNVICCLMPNKKNNS